ncbi:MAG: Uma2 family endonuclease [Cyanobacteria bacterium P01_C01_bin.89]
MVTTPILTQQEKVLLQGVSWSTYQGLVCDLAEKPGKRLTYDHQWLEIMTPLPEHEANKRLLGRIVEATTEELGLEIYSLGSTTWSREDLQRGLEPDECYYITSEAQVRGKTDIDLTIDPPPDLAIEIDITSSSLNRLEIYASLGIKEVWRFDGESLFVYVLKGDRYETGAQSTVLPVLNTEKLLETLKGRDRLGENALIRELRRWINQQV